MNDLVIDLDHVTVTLTSSEVVYDRKYPIQNEPRSWSVNRETYLELIQQQAIRDGFRGVFYIRNGTDHAQLVYLRVVGEIQYKYPSVNSRWLGEL